MSVSVSLCECQSVCLRCMSQCVSVCVCELSTRILPYIKGSKPTKYALSKTKDFNGR